MFPGSLSSRGHGGGGPRVTTGSEQPTQRTPLPTSRARRTRTAIDASARRVIARKGILAVTIADIAAEAGRSAMVRERKEVRPR
jgi:hypothetical protein